MTNNQDTTTASGEAGTARRTTAAARWGGLAACVALMPLTTPAIAQMGEGVEAESRQATVIVTATKREASIQDVAASISQVGGDAEFDIRKIREKHIRDSARYWHDGRFGRG